MITIQLIGVETALYQRWKHLIEEYEGMPHCGELFSCSEVNDIDLILQYPVSSIPAIAVDGNIRWDAKHEGFGDRQMQSLLCSGCPLYVNGYCESRCKEMARS